MMAFSHTYILDLIRAFNAFPHDQFERMTDALIKAYYTSSNIFVLGNGGSAAIASHWACDINKSCSFGKGRRFKMICLNDNMSTILAYANDISYDSIFVEQLENFFVSGDVVIGISSSGNSINVLKAIEYAKMNKGITVGLCGFNGGKMYSIVDIPILAKIHDMQKVEDTHMIIAHMAVQKLCEVLGHYKTVKVLQDVCGYI